MDLVTRFSRIRLMCFDVDGVLTRGEILYSPSGEELKIFHVRDGYGLAALVRAGIKTAIITGRSSSIVTRRASELGCSHCLQGVTDKRSVVERLAKEHNLPFEAIGHMGDDLPDLSALQLVGLACCPRNAIFAVQQVCHFVAERNGGEGAAREVADRLLQGADFTT